MDVIIVKLIITAKTTHNKRLTLRRPFGRFRVSVRLGHSATLHSHGSLQPHFYCPANLRFAYSGSKNAVNLDRKAQDIRIDC